MGTLIGPHAVKNAFYFNIIPLLMQLSAICVPIIHTIVFMFTFKSNIAGIIIASRSCERARGLYDSQRHPLGDVAVAAYI